ncbi:MULTISPECIES: nucleoside deaminase [unclassified Leifsonia]|uniref:nucleoside deaminase n=1 Tax=unclassified Leifsonia TaxID=2663824 RepID=UPI0006F9F55E|nr:MULTISPECIES: nucleoside deaminase [unclassified Leifsonia]KQX07432.1 cytidine deaminase [Leifsonia sp. Root1293]KRA11714.1 cytidine deaminase [Leifsonia sp. Root60]
MAVTDADGGVLARAVELARTALEAGDEPFGSVLTDAAGTVLFEDRNRTSGGDETLHPEFEIARWAANNLAPEQRASAVVYTSGEHCPMCSAAHAWVGLGRIVYAASAAQISGWRSEWGASPSPVAVLPISTVAPGIAVDGPVEPFASEVRELLQRSAERR